MILFVLYLYAGPQSTDSAAMGMFLDRDLCWSAAHRAQAIGITADCRLETITYAPETSPFPMPKPERKI